MVFYYSLLLTLPMNSKTAYFGCHTFEYCHHSSCWTQYETCNVSGMSVAKSFYRSSWALIRGLARRTATILYQMLSWSAYTAALLNYEAALTRDAAPRRAVCGSQTINRWQMSDRMQYNQLVMFDVVCGLMVKFSLSTTTMTVHDSTCVQLIIIAYVVIHRDYDRRAGIFPALDNSS